MPTPPSRQRPLLAGLASAAVLALGAPAATAAPAPTLGSAGADAAPATSLQQVAGPSRTTLAVAVASVEYEDVYGSNWRIYKARYPRHGIIWKTNGCSVPKAAYATGPGVALALAGLSRTFRKSCDRHDFGYRNYGSDQKGGLRLDPSESRRKSVDDRFRKNMRIQCKRVFSGKPRGVCYGGAEAFYRAVRAGGGKNFF